MSQRDGQAVIVAIEKHLPHIAAEASRRVRFRSAMRAFHALFRFEPRTYH